MVAKIEQSRAKVVEAEAAVPRSIAEALQSGKLSIADYYKLQTSAPIPRCAKRSRDPRRKRVRPLANDCVGQPPLRQALLCQGEVLPQSNILSESKTLQ